MDRQEAAALCRSYQPGARIALRTLVTGTVVETDPGVQGNIEAWLVRFNPELGRKHQES